MLQIVVGLFVSSVYSFCILPTNEGSDPVVNPTMYPLLYKGMIIIPYNKVNAVHLHHWVVYFSPKRFHIYIYIYIYEGR